MKKLFKILFVTLIFLILLVIIGVLVLAFVINPNDYKGTIASNFHRSTGRTLHIDGNLSWTFFPTLGISVANARIDNPKGLSTKAFVKVKKVEFLVDIMPLFSSRVHVQRVVLDGLTVNLIKSSATQNNWTIKPKMPPQVPVVHSHKQVSVPPSPQEKPDQFQINSVSINNAQINYTDLTTHQQYAYTLVSAEASNITLAKPFSVTATMIFAGKNLLHPIHYHVNTTVLLSRTLDAIQLKPLVMTLDKSNINGNINIANAKTMPNIKLLLNTDQLNVSQYVNLKGLTLMIKAIHLTSNLKADATKDPVINTLNGVISLHTGKVTLQGFSLSDLLKQKDASVSGLSAKKTNIGSISSTLQSSLLGTKQKTAKKAENAGKQTSIPFITINSTVKQGVVHTDKILIANKNFIIQGHGTLDLTHHNALNYSFIIGRITYKKQQGKQVAVKDPVPIPVSISGTLNKPHYAIDIGALAKEVEQNLLKNVKEGLFDNLKDKLQQKGSGLFKKLFDH